MRHDRHGNPRATGGRAAGPREGEGALWWQVAYDDRWSVASLLAERAAAYADLPALWSEWRAELSHAEIARRAASLRAVLAVERTRGARAVGCLATLDAPWYVAVHAVMTSGIAYAALEPGAPDARLAMCLEDCGADVLLADKGAIDTARRLAGTGRRVVSIEDAAGGGASAPPDEPDPTATAAYIFTSGSTGRPKAVVRSHRSFAHAIYCLAGMYGYAPNETMLYPGSPAHVGSLNDALSCMLSGFRSIPLDIATIDLRRVGELIVEQRADIVAMPPSLLRLLVNETAFRTSRHRPRVVVASGEPLLRSDVGRFFAALGSDTELWQNYGSTETGPMYAGRYTPDDARGSGPLPLRRAHHACALDIIADSGAPAAADEVGEIVVRSEYLADAYLNAPPDQAARFGGDRRGRVFRIGDRGRFTATGELVVAGRSDRQVKVHGRRLELGDVESAILADAAWAEAAVVDAGGARSARLVAVLAASPGGTPDLNALRRRLTGLLPEAAIPRRFIVAERMPRTDTGKVDIAAVTALARTSVAAAPAGAGGPPEGSAESWVADVWQHVLGIARPGREDRFSELGGDSLAAVELSLLLEKRFGIRLSIDRVMERQTIASQVAAMERVGYAPGFVRSLRADGRGTVLVLVPGAGGHAWVFGELERCIVAPCDVMALSSLELAERHIDTLTREVISAQVEAALHPLDPQRPLVIAGYSFGAVMAADIAYRLLAGGRKVEHILLIDPSPLDANRPNRSDRTLRSRLGRLKRRVIKTPNPTRAPRGEAARVLDEQVKSSSRALAALYLGQGVALPEAPTALIVSDEFAARLNGVRRVLGRPISGLGVDRIACRHIEVLRRPAVEGVAAWVERVMPPP